MVVDEGESLLRRNLPMARCKAVRFENPSIAAEQDLIRWIHLACVIILPPLATLWGIMNLVQGKRRSGLFLFLVPMGLAVTISMLMGFSLPYVQRQHHEAWKNKVMQFSQQQWQLTEIDGSTYLCETIGWPQTSPVHLSNPQESKTIYELRHFKIEVIDNPSKETDPVNGIRWSTVAYLKADAIRRYCPQPFVGGKPDKGWTDWISAPTNGNLYDLFPPLGCIDVLKIRCMTSGGWEAIPSTHQALTQSFPPGQTLDLTCVSFNRVKASDLPK
jgi:hypothetical protein